MRRIFILLSIFLFFLILSGCTVNSTTGKIMIINSTNNALTNIKIGSTLITSYVAPGATYDYWYFNTITGKLSLSGVDHLDVTGADPNGDTTTTGYDDLDYTFKVNQLLIITAQINNTDSLTKIDSSKVSRGDTFIWIRVTEQGSDDDFNASDWCEE